MSNDREGGVNAGLAAIAGGFVGTCLVFVAAIVNVPSGALDAALTVAVCSFATAIPFSVLAFTLAFRAGNKRWLNASFWIACLGVAVGIGAALGHIDRVACFLYIGATVFCCVLLVASLSSRQTSAG
jgi:hypothetical protein